jgi:predicted RNA-binding protein with PUA-like domain
MSLFLAKSEPQVYSIEDLEKEGITNWDGVHNFQALQYIRSWQVGDLVLIYHSGGESSIAGLAQVTGEAVADVNDTRTSFFAPIKHIQTIPKEERINLKQIKQSGLFQTSYLVRHSRLSVMPIEQDLSEWLKQECQILSKYL